jgi:hypothetical protein
MYQTIAQSQPRRCRAVNIESTGLLRHNAGDSDSRSFRSTNHEQYENALRHTTAMHLLQAGVDIAVIALWLGHESIETTHGYIEADLEMKQRALEKLTPAAANVSRFKAGDSLLQFLSKL